MHIALGYRWFTTAAAYHLERAFRDLGHAVTYVGLPAERRPGYDNAVPIVDVVRGLNPQPDLYLWIDPAGRYFPRGIEDLPIPTACYVIDVHLGRWRERAARFFDAVFVAQRDYVDSLRCAVGHDQVYWLPLAAAGDVHYPHDLPRVYDVGFVGNLARAHRGTARARRLRLIAQRFHTNGFYATYTPEEVGRVYSQARIVFNTSIAGDVTMRIFEASACGALVLTDRIQNGIHDLFEAGREIVCYEDDDDLMRQIEYYLAHEDERATIARAGQRRTQSAHLYTHRVKTIVDTVTTIQPRAPMRAAGQAERLAARREVYTHLHMLDALFDDLQAAGYSPLRRMAATWACLLRRLLF